jgi:Na+-transporting NADH:ubiquinone oxidoreductase subunit NqrF
MAKPKGIEETVQVAVKVKKEIKEDFMNVCKKRGVVAKDVLEAAMALYVMDKLDCGTRVTLKKDGYTTIQVSEYYADLK